MIKRLFETDKRLLLKFAVSLFLTIFLAVLAVNLTSYAQSSADGTSTSSSADSGTSESAPGPGDYLNTPAEGVGQDPGSSLLQQIIGVDASQPLEVILLLTLISLAPSLLIMMTCFARIIIVLGFLRSAMKRVNEYIKMINEALNENIYEAATRNGAAGNLMRYLNEHDYINHERDIISKANIFNFIERINYQ